MITHRNAPKTFGGIGIFVKLDLLDSYNVNIIDQCVEGIQIIQFNEKVSGFTFIVGNCYLAPYNSIYGNISTEFVAHLITQLYLNSEVDSIYVCGDYNAKIGNLTDVMEDIDINLPPHISIDDVIHGHH